MPRRKRNAGSSSDGTEDSDSSGDLEHTDSSESEALACKNARLTRSSVRLSQSSQDLKHQVDQDESPPRTPTGNAPSSESDIDISSPNASHDESLAKDLSLKDSGSDLSHRPKRRRFHESYNFNMKCPTPGCNSLGVCGPT